MPKILGIDRADRVRNHIINGNFDYWQRGTIFNSIVGGYFTDRWQMVKSTVGGTVNALQSTDVPTNFKSKYSTEIIQKTASTSSLTEYSIRTTFERQNARKIFNNQEATLSFWYKSNKVGNHYARLANSVGTGVTGATDAYAEFTVNSADTWEKKIITVTMNIGSFGSNSEQSFSSFVDIGFGASGGGGVGFTQVDVDDYFRLTQVMLNEGPSAAPFQTAGANSAEELTMCQRYYEKTYSINTNPGAATNDGSIETKFTGMSSAVRQISYSWAYKVEKRAAPTVVTYGASGLSGFVQMVGGNRTPLLILNSTSSILVNATDSVSTSTGLMNFQATADAELY